MSLKILYLNAYFQITFQKGNTNSALNNSIGMLVSLCCAYKIEI